MFFPSYLFPLTNLEGPQVELFSRVIARMKFETKEDYEKYFSRLEAFPTQVSLLDFISTVIQASFRTDNCIGMLVSKTILLSISTGL